MARQKKGLAALDASFEVNLPPSQFNGTVAVEYGSLDADESGNSSGTIVVEKTISGIDWYTATLTKPDKSEVTSLAAAGMGYIEVTADEAVRIRMSVAGSVMVYVGAKQG